MRILFFGTAEFAVPSLEALAATPNREILAVVTQPDRPQGRGQRVSSSPVKRAAEQLGLSVLQPRRVRHESFLQAARDLRPDVLVVAAFGQLIPQPLLDLPPLGPINVHGSLLPAYRGAAPIQHAILNGETITGITTMWMDATLDTGDILMMREVTIEPDDNAGTLTEKMAQTGAEVLLETLDRVECGHCPRIPQDNALATYAPPVTPADSAIQWRESAARCRNRIRAMSPRPGAFATMAGRRIKLWSASAGPPEGGAPGEVRTVTKAGVDVSTGSGLLTLLEVQPENSRRMSAADWARGARIASGDRFDIEGGPTSE